MGQFLISHSLRLVAILALWVVSAPAGGADWSNYGTVRDFLVARTNVVELTGENGERIVICPDLQGRIMTSTTGDLEGRSLGWVNRAALERGEKDTRFNNIGGEDRFWLAPEGGPFGICFTSPTNQTLASYTVPAALNEGSFKITSGKDEPYYKLSRTVQLQNAAKTQFNLEITREIHLQKAHHFAKLFGSEAQSALQGGKVRLVGFQTINSIVNRGAAMSRDKGLLAIASVGQFPAGPRTYVILPYKDAGDGELGPVVNADYFSQMPAERMRANGQAVLLLADGKFRGRVGIPQPRAKQVAGSIDAENGVLTLIHFSMPADPMAYSYVDQNWGRQAEPFRGDVVTSYNDGPAEGRPGSLGYYEIQSCSPAAQLPTNKSLSHTQTTFHIEGDQASLARVAKAALGVEIRAEEVARQPARR